MKIAIIGRTEILYNTTKKLLALGYEIPLIITAKEAPEYKVTSDDFKILAEKIGADFISSAKISSNETRILFEKNFPLAIGISMNFPGIIPQIIIDYFKIGILNAHGGDLPRYRGNACQAWAIINGENKIGLCIHKMIGGELDSGDIIEREYFPIYLNTKIGDWHTWAETHTPELFINSIKKLIINPNTFIEKQSKNPKDTLRCYPRRPEDGRIDWLKSNFEIIRLINASSEPYAGAYCKFEDQKCIIWRAELFLDSENYQAIPGQVAMIIEKGIVVVAGNGKLLVTEIEINGLRSTPGRFIKSLRSRLT